MLPTGLEKDLCKGPAGEGEGVVKEREKLSPELGQGHLWAKASGRRGSG